MAPAKRVHLPPRFARSLAKRLPSTAAASPERLPLADEAGTDQSVYVRLTHSNELSVSQAQIVERSADTTANLKHHVPVLGKSDMANLARYVRFVAKVEARANSFAAIL